MYNSRAAPSYGIKQAWQWLGMACEQHHARESIRLGRGTTHQLQYRIGNKKYNSGEGRIKSNTMHEEASVWEEAQLTRCGRVSKTRRMAAVR
jgi:hypothetical protein